MRQPHRDLGHDLDPARWFVVGSPMAGSSASVHQATADGADSIRSVDRYFDPDAFLAWADSVY